MQLLDRAGANQAIDPSQRAGQLCPFAARMVKTGWFTEPSRRAPGPQPYSITACSGAGALLPSRALVEPIISVSGSAQRIKTAMS